MRLSEIKMSELQFQIKLEFQIRSYLKLKCLNFNFR